MRAFSKKIFMEKVCAVRDAGPQQRKEGPCLAADASPPSRLASPPVAACSNRWPCVKLQPRFGAVLVFGSAPAALPDIWLCSGVLIRAHVC